MAVSRPFWLALLLLAGGAFAAGVSPEIRFKGVVTDSQGTVLLLEEQSTGAWHWAHVGGRFLDYTIKTYEPATYTVVLERGRQECRLRLERGRVIDAPIIPSSVKAELIKENLLLFKAAAVLLIRETSSRYITYDDLVGPGKYLEHLQPVAGEDYRGLTMMKGEERKLVVTTADGTKISF
jgi:hypothetical protein